MTMKKIVVRVLAPLALVAGLVFVPASAANAADVGVDMDQACQLTNGASYVSLLLDSGNAYSWRCWVPPWGVYKSVNVQLYCSAFGYGTAVVLDPSNAYSWRCRS